MERIFGQGRGVVNPLKITLSSSLIIMQNLITVSHTVWLCEHIEDPPQKFRGCWGPAPLEWGMTDPLETCPSHVLPHQIWSL